MKKHELKLKIQEILLLDRKIKDVAENTGLNVATVHNLAKGRGNPNKTTLRVIADYLGIEND